VDHGIEVTASPAARALFSGLIDYAGLFPPAALPLEQAVAEYTRARRSPHAWLLGRLVLPAARLSELAALLEAQPPEDPWPVSALTGGDLAADAAAVAQFQAQRPAGAFVDSVETRAATPTEVRVVLDRLPAGTVRYVELAPGANGPLLAALRACGARAKLRTGGVVPAAIPEPADVARFISACAAAGVAFKATAGLHHPLRRERPLTYAPDAPRATMHGFLNVFAAALFARSGAAVDLEAVLREESPAAFRLDADGLAWRQERVSPAQIADGRASFAVSFGSCSFAEPVEGLQQLELIA
jgi:hypothetical protein